MFSANEEADDIQTPDLKYLLLPFLLGELLAACQEARLSRLQQASGAYDRCAPGLMLRVLSASFCLTELHCVLLQVLQALQALAAMPRLAQAAKHRGSAYSC